MTETERRAAVEQAAERMQALAVQIKNTEDSSTILALTKGLHQTATELRRIVRGGSRKREPSTTLLIQSFSPQLVIRSQLTVRESGAGRLRAAGFPSTTRSRRFPTSAAAHRW